MGEMKMRRKIRIMYNDPDATESSSSSSDEDEKLSRNGEKVVREIEISISQKIEKKKKEKEKNNKKKSCLKQEANNTKKSSSKVKGVRRRPSGNYGAEITHPTTKKKIWLGTFCTKKEAAAAYLKKEDEFNKLRMDKSGEEKEEEESDGLPTFSSPSSVLDITTTRTSISERVKLSFTVVEEEEVSVVDLFEVPLLSLSASRELLDLFDAPEERYSHSASFEVSIHEEDEAFKECNDDVVQFVQGDYEFEQQQEEGGEKGVIFSTDIWAEELLVSPSASHGLLQFEHDFFDAEERYSYSASFEVSIKEDEAFKECNNVVQFVQGDYEFEQQQQGEEEGGEKGVIFIDICAEDLLSPSISEKYLDFGYDEIGKVVDNLGYEEGCCMVEKCNILDWPVAAADDDDDDVRGFSDIESFILSI